MTVYELNREQIIQLKESILIERMNLDGDTPSWFELADVDNIVSDDDVQERYSGTEFYISDFS